jgi:hypothetical protein
MANRTPLVVATTVVAIAVGALLAGLRRRRAADALDTAPPAAPAPAPGASPAVNVPRQTTTSRVPDDVTLTRKVETELFRSPEVPRGNITVDAHAGVVTLRGQVESAGTRHDLAQIVGNVAGVRDVRNELELAPAEI